MIDFDKLAEAYELAYETNHCLSAEIRMIDGAYACAFHLLDNVNKTGDQYFNVDALLTKLSEKKYPSSKYKCGQTVWRLNDEDEPQSLIICTIDGKSKEMYLDEDANWWMEEHLYESRMALIEAQIEYWQIKRIATCEHRIAITDCNICNECDHGSCEEGDMRKCFKCGELFR